LQELKELRALKNVLELTRTRMKVTPLDLRQQRFQTTMRGYDRGEVNAFLAEAAEDYENALRDNERLRQEMAKSEAVLNEHRGQEKNLRNTLLTAQKLADEIRESAERDAGRILREAEGRSDLLLQKCQARVEEVQREIDGLRMKRREVETNLEGIIATLHNTINFVREQDARQRTDEKILLHRPRPAEPPAVAASQTPIVAPLGAVPAITPMPAALHADEPLARTSQG
jgi:cell division initiation protein